MQTVNCKTCTKHAKSCGRAKSGVAATTRDVRDIGEMMLMRPIDYGS